MLACEEVNSIEAPVATRALFMSGNMDDEMLAAAYLTMKLEGLLPLLYYEGIPSLTHFLELHRSGSFKFLGVFSRSMLNTDVEMAGIGWLSSISGQPGTRKAEVGYVMFRKFQDRKTPLEAIGLLVDYCFDVQEMDLLVGTTPEKNRAAVAFVRKLGFQVLPLIPKFCMFNGEPCGAYLSYLTREIWHGRTTTV
jgi:RimJ/RimL family protein N-acetyltransferase